MGRVPAMRAAQVILPVIIMPVALRTLDVEEMRVVGPMRFVNSKHYS